MTIEDVIAAGLDVPRNGKPGPSYLYWPAIWELLVRAAFDGKPCPRNAQIAEHAGTPHETTVSRAILYAQSCGLLQQERRRGARRIILATGQATDWSIRVYRPGQVDSAMGARIAVRRAERERKQLAVLAILAECARASVPPPTNEAIAARLGCSDKTVTLAMRALIADGKMVQHGFAMGRSFVIPGVGVTEHVKAKAKQSASKAQSAPKARSKANWYMMRAATKKDDAFRAAMLKRATRVDAVDAPVTGDSEHAAMLARFIARGGKPMKCPDGFGAHRSIHEVLG